MEYVIFWAMLTILIAFILGATFKEVLGSEISSTAGSVILSFGTFLFVLCIMGFIYYNQDYFEKKKYSTAEYCLNERIVTVEENNAVKVDTLYSFEKWK